MAVRTYIQSNQSRSSSSSNIRRSGSSRSSLKLRASVLSTMNSNKLVSWITLTLLVLALGFIPIGGNPEAKRLYDDLLSNYNRLIRPVGNNSDRLTVKLGLRLSQLIDVNLKSQIMTTNVWVEQEWSDYKLTWNPDDYGGVETLHVPSEHIWLPDIVLYNNADGNYEVTIMTKAILNYTGTVRWKPPAIYKSSCEIDVEFFPFDEQTCTMKFGSWTYDGYTVDLRHINQTDSNNDVELGMDLQDYYISVEWDIMKVPAQRHEEFYSCCENPYVDIVFNITLRRKTLFYTVNLIIPCVGISFLSVLVFYLPSDSGEKMSLCISILLSLTVFFLLLAEIIPPTSLAVPLLGKYLLFTMILITFSVIVTICILNVNYRSPATHKMSPWVRTVFIEMLPKYLFIKRPNKDDEEEENEALGGGGSLGGGGAHLQICHIHGLSPPQEIEIPFYPSLPSPIFLSESEAHRHNFGDMKRFPSEIEKSATNIRFVAQHMKNKDRFEVIEEDWKYVAMVLDRLFLWIFTLACILGTVGIIFRAPSLYDTNRPIDVLHSKIAKAKMMSMGPEED